MLDVAAAQQPCSLDQGGGRPLPHGLFRQSHLEETIQTHTGRVTVILLCTEEFSSPLEAVLLDETHYNAAVVGGALMQYQNTKIKVRLAGLI